MPSLRRVLAAALLLVPVLAWPQASISARLEDPPDVEAPPLVAEALFLCDPLPPGGRDLNLSVAASRPVPAPTAGGTALAVAPRMQLAVALGERLGLTAEVGLGAVTAPALDSPAASLKVLLREPGLDRTGLAMSFDLVASTRSLVETEAGVGAGVIRALGPVTLRGSATLSSAVRAWEPHLHAGSSAAVALGPGWRALGELVADVRRQGIVLSAGPTFKVALGERAALMAGALFQLSGGPRLATLTAQLGHAL
jgi:hypothetical protein